MYIISVERIINDKLISNHKKEEFFIKLNESIDKLEVYLSKNERV